MTPTEINTIVDRALDAWFSDGPWVPGCTQMTLRDRCADMIREALKLRDKQWEDGNATLRHERDAARESARRYEGLLDMARRERDHAECEVDKLRGLLK